MIVSCKIKWDYWLFRSRIWCSTSLIRSIFVLKLTGDFCVRKTWFSMLNSYGLVFMLHPVGQLIVWIAKKWSARTTNFCSKFKVTNRKRSCCRHFNGFAGGVCKVCAKYYWESQYYFRLFSSSVIVAISYF